MRPVLLAALCLILANSAFAADDTIKIGEINSYKALPLYTETYRKGWQLAVEEINDAGGINGRKIEVIDRDDLGKPEEAVRVAENLLLNDKIDFLSGTMFGNVGLALGEFASKNKIPTMRWYSSTDNETKRESNYAFALNSLVTNARAPAQYVLETHPHTIRWASIAPNYAFGRESTKLFSNYLKNLEPATIWSDSFWFPFGKLDAATTIGAIQRQKPDAVMNASVGQDVTQLIRASTKQKFDQGKIIVSLEIGIPEYFSVIGAECPENWIMTGYDPNSITTPAHKDFVRKYEAKYGEKPGWMSLNGYDAYQFIFAALKKSPTLKADDLVTAMEGITVDTPIGKLTMRKADHLSTQGIWVGVSHVAGGKPELTDIKYYSGEQFLVDETKVNTK